MNRLFKAILFVLLIFIGSSSAFSQAPQLINFQAQLNDTTLSTVSVTFAIYDAPTGGSLQWSETHPTLSVTNGRIQAMLGSISTLENTVFESDGDRYIQINVNGESLTPRSQITSVGYALRAATADRLTNGGTGSAGVSSLNTLTGEVTLEGGSNVSITADGQALRIDATGGDGTGGITTINAGTGIAVSDTDGPVTEISLAAEQITDTQILDNSLTANSLAAEQITDIQVTDNSLTANSLAANSVGDSELQDNITLGPSGSLTIANSSNQPATLLGTNSNDGFLTIRDRSNSYDAVTVTTRQDGTSGHLLLNGNDVFPAIDMFPDSETDGGRIVLREPQGATDAVSSIILTAKDQGGRVVVLNENDVVIAIKGDTQDIISKGSLGLGYTGNINDAEVNSQYNLDVLGDARITGNLSKGSGSFTIDHPLDPTNKYLSHSFVESPDMMNVYNGNVELDENGEAVVELPEWFDSLNIEFRYQLTCIGGYAPVYIAEKIQNNTFKIAGGVEGLEVSWLVTGIRNDPYARLHRIQVEEEKNEEERGTYMHPDAYGQNR